MCFKKILWKAGERADELYWWTELHSDKGTKDVEALEKASVALRADLFKLTARAAQRVES